MTGGDSTNVQDAEVDGAGDSTDGNGNTDSTESDHVTISGYRFQAESSCPKGYKYTPDSKEKDQSGEYVIGSRTLTNTVEKAKKACDDDADCWGLSDHRCDGKGYLLCHMDLGGVEDLGGDGGAGTCVYEKSSGRIEDESTDNALAEGHQGEESGNAKNTATDASNRSHTQEVVEEDIESMAHSLKHVITLVCLLQLRL